MLSNCKYAIFDNDGTILNSMYYWRLGVLEYAMKYDLDVPDMSVMELLTQSSRGYTLAMIEKYGLNEEEVIAEENRFMDNHYQNDVLPKRGIEDVFRILKENGAKICVATAAPRGICYHAMEKFGYLKYLDFVVGGENLTCHKGHPEFFHEVSAMLGTTSDQCWVFEDSLYALKGAKAAGCKLVAIEDVTQARTKQEIMDIADIYVTRWAELTGKA